MESAKKFIILIFGLILVFQVINLDCEVYAIEANTPIVRNPQTNNFQTKNHLNILGIGNSFTCDSFQYLYKIAKNLGVENVNILALVKASATIDTHYNLAKKQTEGYILYYMDSNGTFKEISNVLWTFDKNIISGKMFNKMYKSMNYPINADIEWDYISIQQGSHYSGMIEKYDNLSKLINYIRKYNKSASIVWNMTWAYPKYSDLEVFLEYFNGDQNKMYEAIVNNVKEKIVPNKEFVKIIPNGTAFMNARLFIKDELLHRDGFHLSYQPGRYLAGLTAVGTILDADISVVKFRPDPITDDMRDTFIKCAKEAIKNPFEIMKV